MQHDVGDAAADVMTFPDRVTQIVVHRFIGRLKANRGLQAHAAREFARDINVYADGLAGCIAARKRCEGIVNGDTQYAALLHPGEGFIDVILRPRSEHRKYRQQQRRQPCAATIHPVAP